MRKNKFIAMFLMLFLSIATLLATAPKTHAYNTHTWSTSGEYKYLQFAGDGFYGSPGSSIYWSYAVPSNDETYTAPSGSVIEYSVDKGDTWNTGGLTVKLTKSTGSNWTFTYLGTSTLTLTPSSTIGLRYKLPQDLDAPIINGISYYQTNVDNPISIENIKSFLTAIDNVDGDVTDNLAVVSDGTTYSPSSSIKTGDYTAKFSVHDKAGNYNYHTVNVTVYDITKPTITFTGALSSGTLTSRLSNPFTGNINNLINVTDNYDTKHNITINVTDTGDTINWNTPGTYNRTITANDSSGNMQVRSYKVIVIDDVAPVITSPSEPLQLGANARIGELYFLSLFSAIDNVDGEVPVTLVDNPSGYFYNKNKPGTYTETLRAVDNAGNVKLVDFDIEVYDNVPPAIFVNEEFLILNIDDVPTTLDGIISFFQKTGQVAANYDIQFDNFTGNEDAPGVYGISLMSFNSLGESTPVDIQVRVLDIDETGEIVDETINTQTFFEKHKEAIIITSIALVLVIGYGIYWYRKNN